MLALRALFTKKTPKVFNIKDPGLSAVADYPESQATEFGYAAGVTLRTMRVEAISGAMATEAADVAMP